MANVKITDLTAYTNPVSTDVLPIVDVGADVTKKVSIADLLENAGSGTAAAPGIAFDGDSDTGIYRPGANQVAISTNGTGRLFVESTGSTRIEGTGGPSLIIKDTDSASGASTSYLRFWGSDAETGYIGFVGGSNYYINNSRSSGAILFRTEDTERLRITADGKLGLGTSSPQDLFHVEGASSPTIRLRTSTLGSNASPASVYIDFRGFNQEIRARIEAQDRRTNVNGGFLRIGTADNTNTLVNAISIDNAQQVGIGVTSPSSLLHLADAGDITVGTTTGTKIGTATSQKIGFYNTTPVVQPTTGVAEAAFVENSGGTAVNVDSTFGGYTIQQVVEALQTLGLLA